MFTFAYPELLFLLLSLPLVAGLFLISRYRRRRSLRKLGNPQYLEGLMPDLSKYKPGVKISISLLGLAAIIFAFARPWGGIKNQENIREGIEIVIAVDASNSMLASATGEEGGIDRMRTAKLMLEKLIGNLHNDRVGLIAFAGDAYTLIPVTNDYVSAKAFLNSIDPTQIPYQGTNIGAAVRLAENSFSDNGEVGKAIILITDAEELEDQEGVMTIVKDASRRGIQTDVVGIGSSPVTIPDNTRGRMIDEETGDVVRTGLNEDLAVNIARAGDGIYVNAANVDAIDELVKHLGTLKKSALQSSFMVTHDELYFPFVIFAIVMLMLDFLISDKRNRWLDRISFFSGKHGISLLVLTLSAFALQSCGNKERTQVDSERSDAKIDEKRDSLKMVYSLPEEYAALTRGNEAYRSGNLLAADSSYVAALSSNPQSVVGNMNLGLTTVETILEMEQRTQNGQLPDSVMESLFTRAKETFMAAAMPKVEKNDISSLAYYNLGNLTFTQRQYKESIEAYKEALRLNPNDDHARRNLRIAQLQKGDNDQQNQQQNQQNQQNEQKEQNQQQNRNKEENKNDQQRQQMNEQTMDQILDAAERKENMRRVKVKTQPSEPSENAGSSRKRW